MFNYLVVPNMLDFPSNLRDYFIFADFLSSWLKNHQPDMFNVSSESLQLAKALPTKRRMPWQMPKRFAGWMTRPALRHRCLAVLLKPTDASYGWLWLFVFIGPRMGSKSGWSIRQLGVVFLYKSIERGASEDRNLKKLLAKSDGLVKMPGSCVNRLKTNQNQVIRSFCIFKPILGTSLQSNHQIYHKSLLGCGAFLWEPNPKPLRCREIRMSKFSGHDRCEDHWAATILRGRGSAAAFAETGRLGTRRRPMISPKLQVV